MDQAKKEINKEFSPSECIAHWSTNRTQNESYRLVLFPFRGLVISYHNTAQTSYEICIRRFKKQQTKTNCILKKKLFLSWELFHKCFIKFNNVS